MKIISTSFLSKRFYLLTLLLSALIALSNSSNAQILSYTTSTSGALNSVAANATGTALALVNGATKPSSTCSTGLSVTTFSSTKTYSSSLAAIQVTCTPNTGYALNVTGFTAGLRRSSEGPADVRYAYSTNGGTTWTDQGSNQSPDNASCGTTTTGTWATSFTVSAPNVLMFRVYGFDASSTSGTFQILDLSINGTVTSSGGSCAVPSGLSASSITNTSATLGWTAVSGAASYNIQYQVVGASSWTTTTSTTNSVAVSGLTAGNNYQFEVQTVCSGSSTSAYSAATAFTTTSSGSCAVPSGLSASSITTSSATLGWTTVSGAASYNIQYQVVGASSWTTTTSTTNSVAISGLTAGTNYQFEVQTVCSGSSTSAYSAATAFTTTSSGSGGGSTGKITIYFNNPVNTSVSTGVNAVYLNSCMADTIIAYINRAKYSVDIAQYEYEQTSAFSNIATAVNNAYARGVVVRWIYCASGTNTSLSSLNSGIHTLSSPKSGTISPCSKTYDIMHDKFVIIDANSTNPNDAIVMTGSPDWNADMFNHDFNNLIFIQDSALAHAYTNQFNLMWGSTTATPNSSASLWGPCKPNSGKHIFTIAGKEVELYFSPSDSVNNHVLSTIESANTDLYFGMYTFTDGPDASQIVSEYSSDGVVVDGVVDNYSTSYSAYTTLKDGLTTTHLKVYDNSSYIYHNKYAIVDPSNTCSDPQVLTGSFNWTVDANTESDENTTIIHNDTIANIYYQAFNSDFTSLGGTLSHISVSGGCGTTYTAKEELPVPEQAPIITPTDGIAVYPNPSQGKFTIQYGINQPQNVQIRIYNALGQLVSTVVNNEMQQQGTYQYSFTPTAQGMYIATITIGNKTYTKKVVRIN